MAKEGPGPQDTPPAGDPRASNTLFAENPLRRATIIPIVWSTAAVPKRKIRVVWRMEKGGEGTALWHLGKQRREMYTEK